MSVMSSISNQSVPSSKLPAAKNMLPPPCAFSEKVALSTTNFSDPVNDSVVESAW